MIEIPSQPLAQKILAGAFAGGRVPQQLLFFGPAGSGKRHAAQMVARELIGVDPATPMSAMLDLSVIRASGAQILVEDLEDGLKDLSTRPVIGRCRVVILDGAERLGDVAGNRVLKPLEEPPAGAHVILITDRAEDVLPTIRSRCIPVPFRTPGWRHIADALVGDGVPEDVAVVRARSQGAMARVGDPFWQSMRGIGVDLGRRMLHPDGVTVAAIIDTQTQMERAAAAHPSQELIALRASADALEGKRGGRTAAKKAEDQEKRERRRLVSDGWATVLTGAVGVIADALAISIGADGAVRHPDLVDELRAAAVPREVCVAMCEQIEAQRAELALNPTVDLAMEALVTTIAMVRRGDELTLKVAGRLPW
jgi:DNA polymerase-3 subunit delta'